MKQALKAVFVTLLLLLPAIALAQASPLTRDQTRERLRDSLNRNGSRADINISFHQSDKNPWNFVGSRTTGLKNLQSLEVVLMVTDKDTISIRAYPHYGGGYINLEKATDKSGLMRKLLLLSDHNFMFWGADDTSDIFTGYTFTLESGYPDEAMLIVLRSLINTDDFVGQLRPFIDGSTPAPK
jgi:hypothetical protein